MNKSFRVGKNELCLASSAARANNLFVKTFGQRLRHRIADMGLTEPEVARRARVEARRFNNYVNDKRQPDFATLLHICRVVEATPDQLFGLRPMPTDAHAGNTPDQPELVPPEYVAIRHLELTAGMGNPVYSEDEGDVTVAYFPSELIKHTLRATPEDLRFMEVEGPSMAPVLLDGDQVLVDVRKRNPSQPAIFMLWDGFGRVAKWVERVHKSDPPRLRISSENPRFEPYEALAEETNIIGRIVWFARRI